jgi:hypothetical protein
MNMQLACLLLSTLKLRKNVLHGSAANFVDFHSKLTRVSRAQVYI